MSNLITGLSNMYNEIAKALTHTQGNGEVTGGTTPVKAITGIIPEHDCLEHLEADCHWLYKWQCEVCGTFWEEATCLACKTATPFRVDLPIPDFCSGECEYDYRHCGVRP